MNKIIKNKCMEKTSPKKIKNSILNWKQKIHNHMKRPALSTLPSVRGSMTLEAAIILPLYIFFFLNLIFYIEVFQVHAKMSVALREIGNEMSVYGYLYDELDQEDNFLEQTVENIGFSYLYVKNKLISIVGEEYIQNSPITGGTAGLNFYQSEIMNNENEINIVLTYEVSPFIHILGFKPFRMINQYYSKAYVGYTLEKKEDTQLLYYTEHGTVYHSDKLCTYLTRNITKITLSSALAGNYDACSLCKGELSNGSYYITKTGTHYHVSNLCGSLYRDIHTIEVTLDHTHKMCSKCGKE